MKPKILAAFAASVAVLFTVGNETRAQTFFPVGTPLHSVDPAQVKGVQKVGRSYIVPLAGASPAWLTDARLRQVRAAQGRPVAALNDAPLPSTIGIRPGAWMVAPNGCTMNFIFQDGQGRLAIGTAGHCVNRVGESVVLLTLAPGSGTAVLVDIGTVVFRRDAGIGEDFALVQIRPELYSWVSPTIALIGGPCGTYGGSGPELVFHHGHGLAIGTGGTPRTGLALNWTDDAYGWDGLGIFGDSGSPVRITDDQAAGNLTHIVVDSDWLPGFIVGTRVTRMLEMAPGWRLVDSPLCTGSLLGLGGRLRNVNPLLP